jgi:hypothetical protein
VGWAASLAFPQSYLQELRDLRGHLIGLNDLIDEELGRRVEPVGE